MSDSQARKYPKVVTAIVRWFDNAAEEAAARGDGFEGEDRIDWVRCIPFLAVHGMCLFVFVVGWSWIALATCAFMYFFRMFAITAFYHRYFSHRTFKTSRFWQFVFAVWGNSSAQRGPLWWAAHHRHHHRHSDKEEDVHSPHQHSFAWSHMFWITSKSNFPTQMNEVKDLAKYPELVFLDRFDILVPVVLGFLMFGFGGALNYLWPALGTSAFQMLVWGFFVSTVLLFHGTCTINSLAHLLGRQRYKTTDQSRNSLLLALITMGEGWHNNHHYYPAAARQGFYWWEIDMSYYCLKLMSFLGIVWDLKPIPRQVRENAKALLSGKGADASA